jgi:hypothetical protein
MSLSLRFGAIAIAVCAVSCGGGSSTVAPSSSTPAPSVALFVVSGETGAAVGGARFLIAGQTLIADQAGQVATPAGTADGALVDIVAPGFLDRQTVLRSAEPRISLWPTSSPSGLDPDFSSTLVYSAAGCPTQNAPSQVLRRHATSTTTVFVTGLLDGPAENVYTEALRRLNAATGGIPRYVISADRPTSGVVFTVQIDPAAATCTAGSEPLRAGTTVTLSDGVIVGGTMTFCTLAAARDLRLVLHELGHTYGLFHSSSVSDVMWCTAGRPADYAPREVLAMALMRQRRVGNRWPDNDRSASASLGWQEERTSCGAR